MQQKRISTGINIGDYLSTVGNYDTIGLNKVLTGDGWIKFGSTGLTEAQVDRAVMFLHSSTTFPPNNLGLTAYIFWYSGDHKARAEPGTVTSVTFSSGYWLRMYRKRGVMSWQYSTDNVHWTTFKTANISGNLYAGLMFLLANTQVLDVTIFGFSDY